MGNDSSIDGYWPIKSTNEFGHDHVINTVEEVGIKGGRGATVASKLVKYHRARKQIPSFYFSSISVKFVDLLRIEWNPSNDIFTFQFTTLSLVTLLNFPFRSNANIGCKVTNGLENYHPSKLLQAKVSQCESESDLLRVI